MKLEYIFIKSVDEYCVSEEMFRNFLCTNERIVFRFPGPDGSGQAILFDEQELKYGIESVTVEKSNETIFHFTVEATGEETEQVTVLEAFDSLIKNINIKCGRMFSINTLWNDVFLYYGKKLYPEISNVENLLRKIIYLFMLKTVGSRWLDTDAPEKFRTSITSVIKKNNKEKDDIHEEWLIYADFISLAYFFTAPYSLKPELNDLFEQLKQYQATEGDIETKGTPDKAEKAAKMLTKEVIQALSDEYEPKSNWDRYFSDKLGEKSPKKFSDKWSSLYDIRNKVAHGKPISKEDFDKASSLIKVFTEAFRECINIIDTLEITAEEAEAVEAVAQQVIPKEPADKVLELPLGYTGASTYPYTGTKWSSGLSDVIKAAATVSGSGITAPVDGIIQAAKNSSSLDLSTTLKGKSFIENLPELPLSQLNVQPAINKFYSPSGIAALLDKPLYIKPAKFDWGIDQNGIIVTKPGKAISGLQAKPADSIDEKNDS